MKKTNVITIIVILIIVSILILGWSQISMLTLLMSDWSAMIKTHTTSHPSLFVSGFLACITALIVGSVLYVVSPFCRRWIKDFFYMNH